MLWGMIVRAVHLLAAVVWVGGMVFLTVVVMPAVRQALLPSQRQEFIQIVGRRYRVVGWASIVALLITGPLMAWQQGVEWDSTYGQVLTLKLILVGLMLVLTALHDFVLGPRAAGVDPLRQEGLRRAVVWLARLNLVVVLWILLCGVWLTAV